MRRPIKNVSLLMIVCLLFGIFSVSAEETQVVESIKISLAFDTMKVGETQKVRVSISPSNAENYELEYSSSNPDVITAAIGSIIANKEGAAEITVKVKDTDISDTVTVTVTKTKDVLVSDIEFENEDIYLERYEEKKIYYAVLPTNATNSNVSFTSLNTVIATVNATGVLYGNTVGSAKIKVQSEDGNITKYVYVTVIEDESTYSDSSTINVRSVDIYDGEDEVTKTVELMRTQTKQFTVQIYPSNARDTRIRWKTADEDIAEVDENGVVKGVSEGTVKIYAISRDNGRQDTITIKVIPYVKYPDNITIKPQENAVLETSYIIKFIPTFYPEDTTETELHWFVYGGNASVDYQGNVTMLDKGKITVQVYSEDWKQSASYEFEGKYSDGHFIQIKEDYNVKINKPIVLIFDTEISEYSAVNNVFVSADDTGNENTIESNIQVIGKQIIIVPTNAWTIGENYIFIKNSLCDIYGNRLGKNIKYKFKTRGQST